MEFFTVSGLRSLKNDTDVRLSGWIQDVRVTKNLVFLIFRDYTGLAQLTVKRDGWAGIDVTSISRESAVSVQGKYLVKGMSKLGVEILLSGISVLNAAGTPLPLAISDPVISDVETRLDHRSLDLRKREVSRIFRAKSTLLWGIRKFLRENGFEEVQTPKIVAASTEGGADLFNVKYFEKEAYLSQSPQLYKEMLVSSGINRVFEVGPAFRAEKHNTVRHINEFTSIDIEMAFSDHEDAMRMLEGSVSGAIDEVMNEMGDELREIGLKIPSAKAPFPRITYREALDYLHKKGDAPPFGEDFTPEQLRSLGEKFDGFYFITKWPSALRPFYTMPDPEDPSVTNSFDLQFQEKEITSGAQRVHDPEMLLERFKSKGLDSKDFSFYLESFMYGMPPHAGWAIGLERLCMIILNLSNIREATLFPRDRNRLVP